ncbi:glycoside hydrolase [Aureobasidium sp. EXF-10728]|nr:glycoside hydrolase [Aureobasidium sp. EXF-10728]
MLEVALFLGLAAAAPGLSVNATSRAPSISSEAITLSLSSLSNYTYTSYPSQTATPTTNGQSLPTDYSEQAWSMLWDQVGPVSTASINYTVSPTPEATPVPPPYDFSSQVTTGNLSSYKFPLDFVWGIASAAYQVEGAAKDEGRGPSIWDSLSHRVPGYVADHNTGDITDLDYYLYPQDILRLKAFNVPYYSFSISWSRIFPFGRGYVNEQGLAHYDDVIQRLVEAGIKPIITLFHWDTPLALMNDYNGWVSEEIQADFLAYAQLIISRYDKYVPIWVTVNEPQVFCGDEYPGFPSGYWPQYGVTGLRAQYYCGHNVLLSHAAVVDWYRNEFKGTGRITFKNSANNYIANTTSTADAEAVARGNDFQLGWFNSPVWQTGDYPASLRDTLGDLLPHFTAAQSAMILGSCDFFAIDGYTTDVIAALPEGVAACASNSSDPNYPTCVTQSQVTASGWDVGFAADLGASWLKSDPTGLRTFLNYLQKTYTGPKGKDIVLSEFGFAEPGENNFTTLQDALYDQLRVDYFAGYLNNLLAAKVEDNVNVTGAIAWGIFDNFEWSSGLSTRFGLQYVNYTTLERYPKASMFTFTDFFKQHGL